MSYDLQTLLPEQEAAGFVVRPWTLEQLVAVAPHLDRAFERAEALGLDLAELDESRDGARLLRLVARSLEDVRAVLAVTLAAEPGELDRLRLGELVTLVRAVIAANRDELKDFFGGGVAEAMAAASSPTASAASSPR